MLTEIEQTCKDYERNKHARGEDYAAHWVDLEYENQTDSADVILQQAMMADSDTYKTHDPEYEHEHEAMYVGTKVCTALGCNAPNKMQGKDLCLTCTGKGKRLGKCSDTVKYSRSVRWAVELRLETAQIDDI